MAIVKITTNGFKLARSIINLIATSGAALGSYKTAITSMYKIYEEVNNALKSQETRKKALDRQVALLIKDLKDPKNVINVTNVTNFEAARKLFRDSCTTTRQKADKMSAEADKMMKQATKGGGTFAMEISLVSKCMELKREARAINDKYSEVKTHHDAVAKKVKDNGFTVKDQTLIEKLIQNTPKPTEIFKRIENMKALVYNV